MRALPRAGRERGGGQVSWVDPFLTEPAVLQSYFDDFAALVIPPPVDPQRVQILQAVQEDSINTAILGSTFAVRERRQSGGAASAALCEPVPPYTACTLFSIIIYILADGPGTLGSQATAQAALEELAGSPYGSPVLREQNVYRVCVDRSDVPADRAEKLLYVCYKVQYPGILQMSADLTPDAKAVGEGVSVRVTKNVWSYVNLSVTRTGGSDLGCTIDYRTVSYNGTGYAQGMGVNYASRVGQLRWLPGETTVKSIIVPIRDDSITALDQTFEIWIYNAVNASMATNETQVASITIVGINNWPEPLFSDITLRTIGAVCGAATAVPCALYLARLIRSIRRDISRSVQSNNKPGSDKEERRGKGSRSGGLLGRLKAVGGIGAAGKPAAPKALA